MGFCRSGVGTNKSISFLGLAFLPDASAPKAHLGRATTFLF